MGRFNRYLATTVAATLLGAGVAACGSSDDGGSTASGSATSGSSTATASDKKVNIAAFILASANTYSQADLEGVKQAAAAAGNATVQEYDGKFDGATQVAQIEDAVASGKFNAFIVFPNDGAAVGPAIKDAISQGITVVAAHGPVGPRSDTGEPQIDGLVATVWNPDKHDADANAQLTIDACKQEHPDAKPCRVAYISGGNTISSEKTKLDEFKTVIATDPDIQLVSQQAGNFLIEDSRNAMENILQANPKLDVLTTSGDQMTVGAAQAIDDSGRKGISIIGTGAAKEGVQAVKDGKWFGTTVFLPIEEGKLAGQIVIDAVRGKQPTQRDVDYVAKTSPIGQTFTQKTTKPFEGQWTTGG